MHTRICFRTSKSISGVDIVLQSLCCDRNMGRSDSEVIKPGCQSREAGSSPPDAVTKFRQLRISHFVCVFRERQ